MSGQDFDALGTLGQMIAIGTPGSLELAQVRSGLAELIETQRETLRMLEAAHRQLGMWTGDNPRIQRAKAALARMEGAR